MRPGEPGEPKPKDPQILKAIVICQQMIDLARQLPPLDTSLDLDSPINDSMNNFYFLFQSILARKEGIPAGPLSYKLQKIEGSYGDAWKRFENGNQDLINEIEIILKEKDLQDDLQSHSIELIKMGIRNDDIDKMGVSVVAEIELVKHQHSFWARLNPLLKKAWDKLVEYGVPKDVLWK